MYPVQVGCANRFQTRRSMLALIAVACLAANTSAADVVVTTNADSGAGSLREAFGTAVSGDQIVFDLPGTTTIILLSDLPTVTADISFANNNPAAVSIDRNGNAALYFTGNQVDPTVLVVNTGGIPSVDADITTAADTIVFGNGDVIGNFELPGTIAPGADPSLGTIGTFDLTGDLNLSGAQVQLDVSASGGATANDLISVTGTVDVSGATLVPNFGGDEFAVGQTFLVLDATNPIVGAFINQASAFALPNNPFLQAIQDAALGADDFGFLIEDNEDTFASIATGCNQLSAATLLDELQASGSPPAAIASLRNGSTEQVALAVNQLSGSIYPTLIGAEITQIQNSLESIRDRAALQFISVAQRPGWTPWVRAYGASDEVRQDECQTPAYRYEVGGIELGCGLHSGGGLAAHLFAHLTSGELQLYGVDQVADTDSYRLGGLIDYCGQLGYLIAAAGAGSQDYDVRRSLTAFDGSSFAESSFAGSSGFGYFELGAVARSCWTPYAALHATQVKLDPITETGDADFALLNDGGDGDSLRGVLGISIVESGSTAFGLATSRLRFGWIHEYLNASETIVSQVANGGTPTGTLTDRGVDPGIDWGFVRFQLDMGVLLGGQFTAAYEGQFNSDSTFNGLYLGTRWVF